MALRFTTQSFQDLEALDDYLSDTSPSGLKNVLLALKKTLRTIEQYPLSGRQSENPEVRIAIEPKYKYLIPYHIDGESVWILRIYHPRRRPLDYLSLSLP